MVDLPGTYSLQAGSADEEVARDFILFGQPDVTVVVVDAMRLERNLNLVLQILEITDRVVVCLNLVDEARRHGITVDAGRLERELGVPVVPTVARQGEGIDALLRAATEVATGARSNRPHRIRSQPAAVEEAVDAIEPLVAAEFPELPNARWVALRLLNADERVTEAVRSGEIGEVPAAAPAGDVDIPEGRARILKAATRHRWALKPGFHDALAGKRVPRSGANCRRQRSTGDQQQDRGPPGPFPGPLADQPRVRLPPHAGRPGGGLLAHDRRRERPFRDAGHPPHRPCSPRAARLRRLGGTAVVAERLPLRRGVPRDRLGGERHAAAHGHLLPLFTLLEDFGYLPRVAFNLDSLFRRAGAHGKQALTMSMGFGCNAAGVVATRVIDSPRERLIAIITNNFSLCNGRWPTQILIATIFIGALVPPHLAGLVSAGAVVSIALLGILFMFLTSWGLSRTVLKGEATTFSLELPPYRPPRVLQTLYTSVIDRTLIILWRAVLFAVPAGAVIWLLSNISVGGASLAEHGIGILDPFGILIGLNGVILLAYVIAIPANEIVIPTVLMLTVAALGNPELGAGAGVMFETDSVGEVEGLLSAGGWTLLTGVNLMLFSLLHNPCSNNDLHDLQGDPERSLDDPVRAAAARDGVRGLFSGRAGVAAGGRLISRAGPQPPASPRPCRV